MALELTKGIQNCSVIYDKRAFSVDSLKTAVDFLSQQSNHSQKSIILSDIPSAKNITYQDISEFLITQGITRIIGIGSSIKQNADKFKMKKDFYENTSVFLQEFNFSTLQDESILIIGHSSFTFEKINTLLQHHTHHAHLEVDLDAVAANFNYFKKKLKAETKIMALVKAFSYGSSTYEIAKTLVSNSVDYLGVTYTHQGVQLRKAGIKTPIIVLIPLEDNLPQLLKFGLEPEIYNFKILDSVIKYLNDTNNPKQLKIHLKLDSGMNRLGFTQNDIPELIQKIQKNSTLKIQSIFSHLAATDDVKLSDFTHQQVATFNKMAHQIKSSFNEDILIHISNSAGISHFPEYQMNMVRIGIGMYGFSPNAIDQQNLQNISSLKTTILQIREIQSGDSVGYSRAFIANKRMKIATIPIGYADGIQRNLGNSRYAVKIAGKEALIIGNICMDMCMIDISEISCQEGDEVVVFDNQEHVNEMARIGQTISYEIITGISQRVKRIFVKK